jgi:hypothetical protein
MTIKKHSEFTKQHAIQLCDCFEIDSCLNDDEEIAMLEENNPELLEAYKALYEFANN